MRTAGVSYGIHEVTDYLHARFCLYLLRRKGPQPLVLYYSAAYALGLLMTGGKLLLT